LGTATSSADSLTFDFGGTDANALVRLLRGRALVVKAGSPPQDLFLWDALYVGNGPDFGQVVGAWSPIVARGDVALFDSSYTTLTLKEIAKRLEQKDSTSPWLLVSHLQIRWTHWKTNVVTVSDGALVGRAPRKARQVLRAFNQESRTLCAFDTRPLGLPIGRGQLMPVALKPLFGRSDIALLFQPLDAAIEARGAAERVSEETGDDGTRGLVDAAFLNRILLNIQGGKSVEIGTGTDALPLKQIAAAITSDGALEVSGDVADLPAGARVQVVSRWSGEDLRLESLEVGRVDCGTLDGATCAARSAAYRLGASALLLSFRNIPLRPTEPQILEPFVFGALTLRGKARIDALRVREDRVILDGSLALDRVK
jgi:hypothetical protein